MSDNSVVRTGREAPAARAESDVFVIMSHHAPAPEARPEETKTAELAPAYASDLRAEIQTWKPDLWVFGHTHNPKDFRIGQTRVGSAPRGYVGYEPGSEWFEASVVEIDRRVEEGDL